MRILAVDYMFPVGAILMLLEHQAECTYVLLIVENKQCVDATEF